MLEELENLNYNGGNDGLLFFVCDIVGRKRIAIEDASVVYSHSYGIHNPSSESVISYCKAFGWIDIDENYISLSASLLSLVNNREELTKELISSAVGKLFEEKIFRPEMFFFDAVLCNYRFRNEMLPLSLSCVRNVLLNQGFFLMTRGFSGTHFYISSEYDTLVSKNCMTMRKLISLEMLRKQIDENEVAGEKAELFVMEYEKKRIGKPLSERIKRISEIDVSAGYDIVSFDSRDDSEPNRFIEVKAVSERGFFWSRNEYEIAKLKGKSYYLYLVELSKIRQREYVPTIIMNPAKVLAETDDWYMEAQSFLVRRI